MNLNRFANIKPFWLGLVVVTGGYLLFVLAILGATVVYSSPEDLWSAVGSEEIRFAVMLSFTTCTISALLSLLVAVPAGYLLSRKRLPFKSMIEAALDIPIFFTTDGDRVVSVDFFSDEGWEVD